MKVNKLNQGIIDKVFSVYKEVTNRHGDSPKLEEVKSKLDENLPFEFISGGFRWSSKLVFKKEEGNIKVEFVYNERIPKFMVDSLKKVKQEFDEKIEDLG